MKKELLEKLFDSDVSLRKILILHDLESQISEIDDLYQDLDDDKLALLIGKTIAEIEEADKKGYVKDLMVGILEGKLLCEVHTPVKERPKGRTYTSFSWGYTTYTYIAADTIEELVNKACAWADEQEVREHG